MEEFRHLLFHTLAIDLQERRFVTNLEHLGTRSVVLPFTREMREFEMKMSWFGHVIG